MIHRPIVSRFVLAAATVAVFVAASPAAAGRRVVAVGDIHGNYDGFVTILQQAGLVDEDTHWIGGDTTLVQTGDVFDRGVDIRKILDLLMRLQDEAAAAGGEVVALIGNHEGMNLMGFYRAVNPEVYATFVDDKAEKRRKTAFKEFKQYVKASAKAAGVAAPPMTSELKDRWMAAVPPGWIEYTEALGPKGRYGAWLRSCPVAVVIDGTLFIHGGVGPDLAGLSVAEINAKVASEVATYDRLREVMIRDRLVPSTAELASLINAYQKQDPPDPALIELADAGQWFIRSPGGPLWFRGAAKWEEETQTEEMFELLAGAGAERMVGGHTVQREGHIQARFGGRVFLIDTGMLSSVYEGGRASALVIENGVFSAVYEDGTEEVLADKAMPNAA